LELPLLENTTQLELPAALETQIELNLEFTLL